jgi:hypothetical protein
MKRLCAWCGRDLSPGHRSKTGSVTHGLCAACRRSTFGAKGRGAGPLENTEGERREADGPAPGSGEPGRPEEQ